MRLRTFFLPSWPRWGAFVLGSWVALSCSPGLDQPGARLELWDESGEELRRLPVVPRLHLRGVHSIALADFWLVQGEISAATGKKLAAREVPAAVSGKRWALSAWTWQDEIIFAPGEPLVAGGVYTLLALGRGVLAELRAADELTEVWTRWGAGMVRPGAGLVYCRMKGLPFVELISGALDEGEGDAGHGGLGGADAAMADPDGWGLPGGIFPAACLTVRATDVAAGAFIPPPNVGSSLLEPNPVWLALEAAQEDHSWSTQSAHEGCAGGWGVEVCPSGPALMVSNTSKNGFALEIFEGEAKVGRVALPSSTPSVQLGPMKENVEYTLRGVVFNERDANEHRLWSATVRTGDGEARFVITEVMADPPGPEPASEWIELQNVGTRAGSLRGFFVGDEAGWSPLPDVVLGPGQFGLIVRRDFAVGTPPPAATATPLWVEELGGNGLRNSGELVQLQAPDGVIQSTVPAKKTAEGVSLARISPWAPDQVDSFSSHGAPGASPGAENIF